SLFKHQCGSTDGRLDSTDGKSCCNKRLGVDRRSGCRDSPDAVLPRQRELRSPLKKPPGEGTGPTRHADPRGNLVGRVPPRGEPDVFQQAVSNPIKKLICNLTLPWGLRQVSTLLQTRLGMTGLGLQNSRARLAMLGVIIIGV